MKSINTGMNLVNLYNVKDRFIVIKVSDFSGEEESEEEKNEGYSMYNKKWFNTTIHLKKDKAIEMRDTLNELIEKLN